MCMSKVRSLGSKIAGRPNSAGGKVPFMKILEYTCLALNQGGRRPGSAAIYIECWDLDVFDFLNTKNKSGEERTKVEQVYPAIVYNDEFMKRLESDTINKTDSTWTLFDPQDVPDLVELYGEEFSKRYNEYEEEFKNNPSRFNPNTNVITIKQLLKEHIIKYTESGMPFVMHKCNVNKANPNKHLGTVYSSNLCVAGETLILTKQLGNVPIGRLVENGIFKIDCWNGSEWSPTTLFRTSKQQEVLTVELDSGIHIYATPYHKWWINDKYTTEIMLETKDLKPGMKLIKRPFDLVEHGTAQLPYAYESGLFTAEGCEHYKNNNTKTPDYILHLYNGKINLGQHLRNVKSVSKIQKMENSIRQTYFLQSSTMLPKHSIPSRVYSVKSRLEWLAGLFDGDGCLLNNNGAQSIQISSSNYDFIYGLHFMLMELGINSKVRKLRDEGGYLLPVNNGTGGYKEYICKTAYRLFIAGMECNKLLELGYKANRVMPVYHNYQRQATAFNVVVSVKREFIEAPTYCGNEPLRNMLTFNGQVTGNCTEVLLPTSQTHTAVCNLGAINLARVGNDIDLLKKTIKLGIRAMDNSIDLTSYPSEESKRFQSERRTTGMGSVGIAELIANKKIYYGSKEHKELTEYLWKIISDTANETSRELAKEKGECIARPGYRNSYLMAIAPNSTSAVFAGTTNGLEPVFAKYWVEESNGKTFVITAPGINEENKKYYVNAFEVDPFDYLDVAGVRQKFIDMGMSTNLFIHPDKASVSYIRDLILYSWKRGLKTLYYLRSQPPTNTDLNDKPLTKRNTEIKCVGCEN